MIINHNMASLNTINSLNANNTVMQKSLNKLSSGLRINSAADDAAGLAISEKMRGQISGLDQASSNAENGISLLQTAEGALDETTSILQRMRELAVESSSDTLTDDDRTDIQSEFSELSDEIDRIANTTQFNTKNLLDGSMSAKTDAVANISANSSLATGATGAVLTTTVASGTTSASTVSALGLSVAGTYSIGGASVTITASTTISELVSAINSGSSTIEAAFDSKGFEITSETTGATSTTAALTSAIGSTFASALTNSTSTAGAAASGKIGTNLSSTSLVSLGDTGNNSLGIQAGDSITIQYVQNGSMTSTTLAVTSSTTLNDLNTSLSAAGSISVDSNGKLSFTAKTKGSEGAVYGLTLTVTDAEGDENSTASSALSDWTQTQAASDQRADGTSTILIGANTGQSFDISINAMDASSLGVANLSVSTYDEANVAISVIDTATATVSAERGKMGAEENRLEHTINNLTTSSENITSAESRIRDVDMASEMANYTKLSVINQAATAMLAQANQLPQQVLSLLK